MKKEGRVEKGGGRRGKGRGKGGKEGEGCVMAFVGEGGGRPCISSHVTDCRLVAVTHVVLFYLTITIRKTFVKENS